MKFGLAIFLTDVSIDPAEVAQMAEERGFESLFVPEHTHIPASRETPYPGGGELPTEYIRMLDPSVALAWAGAATKSIRLGYGISLVLQHDPIVLAKEVATLDHVTGGRVLFGIGAGWNVDEMRNHGVEPRGRFGRMREHVEAMKEIWTEEEASHHGRYVNFDRIWSWPKPVQKPHPPVLIGGDGAKVLERVVAYGDEWYPNRITDDDVLLARAAELQELARRAGREPIPITLNGITRDPEKLRRYEEAGIHRCVAWLPSAPRDQVEPALDAQAAIIARLT